MVMSKKTELAVRSLSPGLSLVTRDCMNIEQLTFPLWFYFFCTQTKLMSPNGSEVPQKYTDILLQYTAQAAHRPGQDPGAVKRAWTLTRGMGINLGLCHLLAIEP